MVTRHHLYNSTAGKYFAGIQTTCIIPQWRPITLLAHDQQQTSIESYDRSSTERGLVAKKRAMKGAEDGT